MKKQERKYKKENISEEQSGGTDYSVYQMKYLEKIVTILIAGGCLFALGYIFYQSIILSSFLALFALKYPKIRTKQIIKSRKKKLMLQFKDMLYSLSSAIGAGNSVEKAMEITLSDLEYQYNDPNLFIIKELELIVSRLEMNWNVEDALNDFAKRSHVEDIKTFANIFEISKRTGGNLIQIIRQSTNIITDKIETKIEIETMLSGQKMEQKVITVIPIVLVYFLTKSSGDFMLPMFTTLIGRVVSTIALVIILVGNLWAKKIADVEM